MKLKFYGSLLSMAALTNSYGMENGIEDAQRSAHNPGVSQHIIEQATKNDGEAEYNLGLMHENNHYREIHGNGRIIEENFTMAMKCYQKAAEKGYAPAQHALALEYHYNPELKDYNKATELYGKAAEQKHASSQYMLANMYVLGQGVTKDPKQALELMRKAAVLGDEAAKTYLKMYDLSGQK